MVGISGEWYNKVESSPCLEGDPPGASGALEASGDLLALERPAHRGQTKQLFSRLSENWGGRAASAHLSPCSFRRARPYGCRRTGALRGRDVSDTTQHRHLTSEHRLRTSALLLVAGDLPLPFLGVGERGCKAAAGHGHCDGQIVRHNKISGRRTIRPQTLSYAPLMFLCLPAPLGRLRRATGTAMARL